MPPTRTRRALLPWLEAALWTLAAVCLFSVAWSWTGSRVYQERAERELARAMAAAAAETPHNAATGEPAGARVEVPEGEMPTLGVASAAERSSSAAAAATSGPTPGEPLARLLVPRLELAAIVAEGTTGRVLQRAVGHLESSAFPGERGNVVLAAHRDTFFRPLEWIEPGDEVVLESAAGRHRYRVEWTRVVDPGETSVADDAGYPALTLVTCYPFRWVGSAPYRFIVRARRLAEPA